MHWTWQAVGREPAWYHAGNIGLHLLNGALVYGVASTLLPGATPLVAAGVFLLAPANSEAVSYVSARADLLATAFVLIAVWLSLGRPTAWRWLLIGHALVAAALSKEIGLIGVLLVALTVVCLRPQIAARALLAPLWIGLGAALGVAWPVLLSWMTMSPQGGGPTWSFGAFVVLQVTAIWRLLALLVWPSGFSIDHDIVGLSRLWTLAAWLLTASSLVLALNGRRRPLVAWGLAWTGVALAPRLLFHTNEFVREYQMYLALVGPILLVSLAAVSLWQWRLPSLASMVYDEECPSPSPTR